MYILVMVPVLLIGLVKILTFVESFGISYQGFTKFHKVSDNLDFDNNVESELQLKIIGLQGPYIINRPGVAGAVL